MPDDLNRIPPAPEPVTAFTLPSVFTLNPSNFGGRKARRGFAFQDLYIAYVLAGFAAGLEDLIAVRVEGVEDLDVLLRKDTFFLERYIQIKSREEGQGAWTINQLAREGVLARFLNLYLEFRSLNHNPSIRLEIVLVVEGDLNAELLQLAGKIPLEEAVKRDLFAHLASEKFLAANRPFRPRSSEVSAFFSGSAQSFLERDAPAAQGLLEKTAFYRELALAAGANADEVKTNVMESGALIAEQLEDFVSCLSFVSRVNVFGASAKLSTLGTDGKDLIRLRLMQSGDVTAEEASKAVDRLLRELAEESAKAEATHIDRTVLERWLSIPTRSVFESKPLRPLEFVERTNLVSDMAGKLLPWPYLNVYSLPKVGKSFLISSLIDHLEKADSYFWFTFSGEPGELLRLLGQLAEVAAIHGGSWQLIEDIARNRLQPAQIIGRLAQTIPGNSLLVVLDDCQNCSDKRSLADILAVISTESPDSRVVLISQEKLLFVPRPEQQVAVHGFDPKEALEFVARLGVDVVGVLTEFAMLSLRLDGHPVMLRAVMSQLSQPITKEDISALIENLPNVTDKEPFIQELSARIFFGIVRSNEQRKWLQRLSALVWFDKDLASKVAEIAPKIDVSPQDWLYLCSLVFDQSSQYRYNVPQLVRHMASGISEDERKAVLVTSARYVFETAVVSRTVDFWDFQGAIFNLLGAEQYEEAGFRFILSLDSTLEIKSFDSIEFLFIVLNSERNHKQLPDPIMRWTLLQAEFLMRLNDASLRTEMKPPVRLLRRMRRLLLEMSEQPRRMFRVVMHTMISNAGYMQLIGTKAVDKIRRRLRRMLAALESALRLALKYEDSRLIELVLPLYPPAAEPFGNVDIELLKDVIITFPRALEMLSVEVVFNIYSQYALNSKTSAAALDILRRHSNEYLERSLDDCFCAAQHAIAQRFHEEGRFEDARKEVAGFFGVEAEIPEASTVRNQCKLLVADTYYAENNFKDSAVVYEELLESEFDEDGSRLFLKEHTRRRALDSLSRSDQFLKAFTLGIAILRAHHRTIPDNAKCRLYSRIAYALIRLEEFRKVAVVGWALCRIAEKSRSADAAYIAWVVANEVIKNLTFTESALIRRPVTQMPEGGDFADPLPVDGLAEWQQQAVPNTRELLAVATVLEYTGSLRRSRSALKSAEKVFHRASVNGVLDKEATITFLRIARLEVCSRAVADAVIYFKKALALGPENAKASEVLRALWEKLLGPSLDWQSDRDVNTFFDSLVRDYAGDVAVQGWLRFWESEIFYDRLAGYDAGYALRQAKESADRAADMNLTLRVSFSKLFSHFEQNYRNVFNWMKDVLEDSVPLFGLENSWTETFGKNIQIISNRFESPAFRVIGSEIDRLKRHWEREPFLIAIYAVWVSGKRYGIPSQLAVTIETRLREKAGEILIDSDFSR